MICSSEPVPTSVAKALPGDKSISHRVLLIAAATDGESRLRGINLCGAVFPLIEALRQLGATVDIDDGEMRVGTIDRNLRTAPVLNLGPSSAAARLLLGLLVGLGVEAVIDGDETLRPRPVDWVVEPLRGLGAELEYLRAEGQLPVRIGRSRLREGIAHLTVGSAQARSAVLLAAWAAGVAVDVRQAIHSRDHTQRLLCSLGCRLDVRSNGVSLTPAAPPSFPFYEVPLDPSAVAYPVAAHLFRGMVEPLRIDGVCLNPTRTGFFETLRDCGIAVSYSGIVDRFGEPVGSLTVEGDWDADSLEVDNPDRFHAMIDEIPLAAAVATRLPGLSRFGGAEELIFKESNRIESTAAMLRAFGAEVATAADGFTVRGGVELTASRAPSFGDHRIAMTAAALGTSLAGRTVVEQGECTETSFPHFAETMRGYGFDVRADVSGGAA
ncbi:MAG: hypothetical protein PHD44_02170 [Halothiobacillus sp.]|nr:hypothetical protein [Halothiobacillus sp.]